MCWSVSPALQSPLHSGTDLTYVLCQVESQNYLGWKRALGPTINPALPHPAAKWFTLNATSAHLLNTPRDGDSGISQAACSNA